MSKDADARIQEAIASSADANKAAKKLEADNLALAGKVAELQDEAAKQQERAAKAELALLELRQRLAHRRISPAQHNKFVAELKPYAGTVVEVTKLLDDESSQFGDDILSALREAKWSSRVSIIGSTSPPRYGLDCSVDEDSEAGKVLARMCSELPTATVRYEKQQGSNGSIGAIFVGQRPAP